MTEGYIFLYLTVCGMAYEIWDAIFGKLKFYEI